MKRLGADVNYESHYGTLISHAMPQRGMTSPKKSGKASITLFLYWQLAMVRVGYNLYPSSTHDISVYKYFH